MKTDKKIIQFANNKLHQANYRKINAQCFIARIIRTALSVHEPIYCLKCCVDQIRIFRMSFLRINS